MSNDPRGGLPSASSFDADVLCPGRRNLIRAMFAQGMPDLDNEAPSEFAARGTRIHAALETDQTFELAPDELAAYNNAVRTKQDVIRQWKEDNGIEGFTEGPREARFWLNSPHDLSPMLSGQLDAHWLSDDATHICIVDFKSGIAKGVEGASVAWQLRCQSLLAWHEYGQTAQKIRVAFVKPEAREELDWCDFSVWDLQNIERYVNHILWQTQQADAPLRAGDHCKYCPARACCPEALKLAIAPIQSLQIVPATNGKITKKLAVELVAVAPVEAVREVYGKRTAITYIMEAVKARLAALPPEEHYRLALKMGLGRSTDYVRDAKGAFDAIVAAGFPEDQAWACLEMNKGAVVEMVQRFRNCRDSEAEATFELLLDDFIERGRGNEILGEA